MAMKKPKYAAITMQEQSDAGINPFAVTLMAEAHADDRKRWGDETVMAVGHAHNGTPVYMLISTQKPEIKQFASWPE
jgi:hypothetical protein